MNQQTANSSLTNNPSASSNLAALVPPDKRPQPKEAATPDAPLPKAVTRKSKAPAIANEWKPKAVAKNEHRCRHYTATGRLCRLAVLDPASGLCFRHVGLQFQPSDEDLLPAFGGLLSKLQSACGIHDFLSQLTVLLVQNRISTRRAAILAYLGQTLLRTLPAIEDELDQSDEPQPFVFDLPRPKRDDDISPERAFVNRMSDLHVRASKPVPADTCDGWPPNPEQPK